MGVRRREVGGGVRVCGRVRWWWLKGGGDGVRRVMV